MAFSQSSRNIRLDGIILKADCARADGSFQESELNLDSVLGNINGEFKWGAQAVSESAFDLQLNDTILEGQLEDEGSRPRRASINLDDCIANMDGVLTLAR